MIKNIYDYRVFSLVRMLFYVLIPLFIMMQPASFMDHQSLCIIQHIFKTKCLFCGMTRAFIHILHFDLEGAIHFNVLSLIVFPIVSLIVIWDCINMIKSKKMS